MSFIYSNVWRIDFDTMTISYEWEVLPAYRLWRERGQGKDTWWARLISEPKGVEERLIVGANGVQQQLIGRFAEKIRLEYDRWLIDKIMEE